MKKLILLFFIIAICAQTFKGCTANELENIGENVKNGIDSFIASTEATAEKEKVEQAIDKLTEEWEDYYDSKTFEGREFNEHLEIINTRVIYINDCPENFDDLFGDIECMVEFELLSNFYGVKTDCYTNAGIKDVVAFYKDGSAVAKDDLLRKYTGITFDFEYKQLDIEVVNLGSMFDGVLIEKEHPSK